MVSSDKFITDEGLCNSKEKNIHEVPFSKMQLKSFIFPQVNKKQESSGLWTLSGLVHLFDFLLKRFIDGRPL